MSRIIYPRPLQKGDRIAILSPASIINPDYVTGAVTALESRGWKPYVCDHAMGKHGNYSGTADERLNDLETALLDPATRAILCSRGGYGVVHLLDRLSRLPLADDPKWIIGFSDISALHALFSSKGIASIHASMAKHLAANGGQDEDSLALFDILGGTFPKYRFDSHCYNRPGTAQGNIVGGNLAVLAGLINTPFNLLKNDCILFIEDIAEPIYKVERILYQLRLSGVLPALRGLIVGQFTEYRADANYSDMETMIRDMVAPYDYPVAFNAPIGHVNHNIPIIENAGITLEITPDSTTITHHI